MVSVQQSVQKANECAEINAGGTAIVLEEAARAQLGCNLRRQSNDSKN